MNQENSFFFLREREKNERDLKKRKKKKKENRNNFKNDTRCNTRENEK